MFPLRPSLPMLPGPFIFFLLVALPAICQPSQTEQEPIAHQPSCPGEQSLKDSSTTRHLVGRPPFACVRTDADNSKPMEPYWLTVYKEAITDRPRVPPAGARIHLTCLAASDGGGRVFVGTSVGGCNLYDTETGALLRYVSGHEKRNSDGSKTNGYAYAVGISPDAKQGLSAGEDGTTILWDLDTGDKLKSFTDFTKPVRCIAFSPNGKSFISGCADGAVAVRELSTGLTTLSRQEHAGAVTTVKFSPDGTQAISGSTDGTLLVWSLARGKPIRLLRHESAVCDAAWVPSARFVLSGYSDGDLILWEMGSGKEALRWRGHAGEVRTVRVLPNERQAISAGTDYTLCLWDLTSGRLLRSFGKTRAIDSVAVFSGGKRAISCGDQELVLWDVKKGEELYRFEGSLRSGPAVTALALSGNGNSILSAYAGSTAIRMWDAASGRLVRTLEGHQSDVACMTFSPNGRQALSGSRDKTVVLWDLATGKALNRLEGHKDEVISIAFSPDGQVVASASLDGTARTWDAKSGQLKRTFSGREDYVGFVTFLSDGTSLLAIHGAKTANIWNLSDGSLTTSLTDRKGWIGYAPQGGQFLVRSDAHQLELWDIAANRLVSRLPVSLLDVFCISPDARLLLATNTQRGSLTLWDVATGNKLRGFVGNGPPERITQVEFSRDHERVVTGGSAGTVRLWDVSNGRQLRCLALPSD